MEREKFKNYLREKPYAESTIYSYSNAIDSISRHISELRGSDIDLYKIYEIPRLIKIRDTYGLTGKHSEFGNRGNGTVRNAINRFVEFREWENDNKDVDKPNFIFKEEELEDNLTIHEEIMGELVLLKMKTNGIDKNRDFIKIIIFSQVIIIGLLIYIVFQF